MTTQEKKAAPKPKIGVYGFTGCAGDQLLIIHTEDELLNLFGSVDMQSFVMATSNPIEGELDVATHSRYQKESQDTCCNG